MFLQPSGKNTGFAWTGIKKKINIPPLALLQYIQKLQRIALARLTTYLTR